MPVLLGRSRVSWCCRLRAWVGVLRKVAEGRDWLWQDCAYGVVIYDRPRVIMRSSKLLAAAVSVREVARRLECSLAIVVPCSSIFADRIYQMPKRHLSSDRARAGVQSGAFEVQEGSHDSALLLQKTQVQCSKVWCTDVRPGRFEARACDFWGKV